MALFNLRIFWDQEQFRIIKQCLESIIMANAQLEEIKAGIDTLNASETEQTELVTQLKTQLTVVGEKVDVVVGLVTDSSALQARVRELEESLAAQTVDFDALKEAVGTIPSLTPILEKQDAQKALLGDIRSAADAMKAKLDTVA